MRWRPGTYSYTFTGLTAGTAYTFSVQAINAVGTGPASASVVVTPTNANFSPSDLSGLTVWLKGSTLAGSNGAALPSWADSSGNANNFAQSTTADQPALATSGIGGLPAAVFNGTSDFLQSGNVSLGTAISAFVVFERTGTAGNYTRIVEGAGGSFNFTANGPTAVNEAGDGTGLLCQIGSGAEVDSGNGTIALNTPYLATMVLTSGTNASQAWLNGALIGTGTLTLSATDVPISLGGIVSTGTYTWPGKIAEIVVYNRAVTGTERGEVESYLRTKYGF